MLAQGKLIPPNNFSKLLANRSVPAQELAFWVEVLSTNDLYEAMERLGLLESGGEGRKQAEFPHWLLLSLPAMLRNLEQAPYLASMLGSPRYRQLDVDRQGLFIARSIQHFLRVRHYVAVRETVEWLCHHERHLVSARTFARCLAALASHRSAAYGLEGPPVEMLSSLTRLLRTTMAQRGVKPDLDVFLALFQPALIPKEPEAVEALLVEMKKSGRVPRRKVLHRAIAVYARAGDVEGTRRLGRRIVEGEQEERPEVAKEDAEVDEVKPTGVYATTELRALDDVGLALAYFDRCLQEPSRRGVPGALPPIVDGVTWSTLFRTISASPTVSSQDLLKVLRKLEKASSAVRAGNDDTRYIPPRPSLHIYHSVMLGLFKRHDAALVVALWVSLHARGLSPDNHILDVLMRAYCVLGDLRSALRLLDTYAHRPAEHPPIPPMVRHRRLPRSRRALQTPPPSNTLRLDVVPVNNLLNHYNRTGLTHNCYRLFCKMSGTYGVLPDATSLSIVVDAARYASAATGEGYGPGSEAISGGGAVQDDLWAEEGGEGKSKARGERAWKVAERICWEVLEGNWPEGVERVKDPLEGGGVVDWLLRRGGVVDAAAEEPSTPRRSFPATLSLLNPPRYPHIYPSERSFRSFIQLLGYHSSPRSIPLVLAWMRYLTIKPSRHTLALAMLYVGELGLSEGKMRRWREWLGEWLGVEGVPMEEEIAFMRRGGGRAGKPVRL